MLDKVGCARETWGKGELPGVMPGLLSSLVCLSKDPSKHCRQFSLASSDPMLVPFALRTLINLEKCQDFEIKSVRPIKMISHVGCSSRVIL